MDLNPSKKSKKDTSKPAKTVSLAQSLDKESDEEDKLLDSTPVISKVIKDLVGFQDGESVDNDPDPKGLGLSQVARPSAS